MKGIRMQKGITLIALIITIVVLLILAMVAISAIQDSSILTHAERSAIMHEVGTISEKIRLESQAIKLETAQGGTKTQTVENALINLYADNNATPIQIEIESATSIPEGITAGKYYVVIPEYLDYNIARGKGGKEAEIKEDTFVVDDNFNVYYLITATVKTAGGGENPPDDPQIGALPDDGNPLTIRAIEDLVDFAKVINAGDPDGIYTGKTVTLETSLDFEDEDPNAISSYRDASNESYGDLNGDEKVENIKTELTTGAGFTPIGTMSSDGMTVFKGTFEGKNNTLYNIHMNRQNDFAVGLFGIADNDIIIQNLKITGNIIGNAEQGIVAGIIGMNYSEAGGEINISNCDISNMNLSGGIVSGILGAVMSNTNISIKDCEIADSCSFPDNIISGAGICVMGQGMENNITIKNCINSVDISGKEVAGIVVNAGEIDLGNVTIENCENNGKISGVGTSSEDVNIAGIASLYDDCSINGNVRIVGCTNNGELTTGYGPVAGILSTSAHIAGESSIIDECVNNGAILLSGDLTDISGIAIAQNTNVIVTDCINNGLIEAKDLEYIDKVAGIIIGYAKEIKGCINNGVISVGNKVKKLSGIYILSTTSEYTDINIENCKNIGIITVVAEDGVKNSYEYKGIVSGLGYIINDGNVRIKDCTNEADIIANFNFETTENPRYKLPEAIIAGGTVCEVSDEGLIVELENLINSGNISTNGNIVSGVYYGEADTLTANKCKNTGNITTTHSEGQAYGVIGGTITNKTETECENTGTITPEHQNKI